MAKREKSRTIGGMWLALAGALSLVASPAIAQVQDVDPDAAIDGDLQGEPTDAPASDPQQTPSSTPSAQPVGPEADSVPPAPSEIDTWQNEYPTQAQDAPSPDPSANPVPGTAPADPVDDGTYQQDDLIGAASDVFGDGAQEVAGLIERILKDQGRPNGYIIGREGSGAFIVGLRYGSGTLYHKVEGKRPVYWTGPSIGFDAGANAGSTFVLVYNLYDTQDLYTRFPAAEGQLYFVGGLTASYLRKGDIVLIPIRVGAGLRAGVNAGYLKLSEKQSWLPF
ncbi:EipA family protein [Pseudoblastomonas halimionae]|nr:EipA family protein [Alteriqipengyuania halimionae]